jgi:Fe-S-cluster containining protein
VSGAALEELPALEPDERFCFACHPGVACFNACCRELDLLLYPYDVLQLRRALSLSSSAFLERHAAPVTLPPHGFPMVQLRMSARSGATCPFVTPEGCAVYARRPAACRAYPLGRGAWLDAHGALQVRHVVVREPHCRGFEDGPSWDAEGWLSDQALQEYNAQNDRYISLIGGCARDAALPPRQVEMVLFALYQVDRFRDYALAHDVIAALGGAPARRDAIEADETAALELAFDWLEAKLG